MDKRVVIIGNGKHAKVVADIIICSGDYVVGFLSEKRTEYSWGGFSVLGTDDEYQNYLDCEFVIAIGDGANREKIANKLKHAKWYTAIHPTAVVSRMDTEIGEGSVILPNCVVNASTRIGKHCILNSGSIVEHDNVISDFVHVSVGAKLAGTVHVGKRSMIGIGATIIDNISICEDCIIGGGGVVTENIIEPGTYVGIPVKKRRG